MTNEYVIKREKSNKNIKESYVTPRTLLGIIRLSQAIAKIRFSNQVTQEDVDEALRLFAKA